MSITNKLKNLNLESDAMIGFSYSAGTDVFVHNETEVETALAETDVVYTFSELVATPGLHASTRFGGDVIQSMRNDGFLEDYERNGDFPSFLAETITDNFYDQGQLLPENFVNAADRNELIDCTSRMQMDMIIHIILYQLLLGNILSFMRKHYINLNKNNKNRFAVYVDFSKPIKRKTK